MCTIPKSVYHADMHFAKVQQCGIKNSKSMHAYM